MLFLSHYLCLTLVSLTLVCASRLVAFCLQLRASNVVAGNETLEALRHRQKLEARAAEEEALMVRVPLSKEQRKKLKADRRGNLSGAAMMNDFADDVADLIGVRQPKLSSLVVISTAVGSHGE